MNEIPWNWKAITTVCVCAFASRYFQKPTSWWVSSDSEDILNFSHPNSVSNFFISPDGIQMWSWRRIPSLYGLHNYPCLGACLVLSKESCRRSAWWFGHTNYGDCFEIWVIAIEFGRPNVGQIQLRHFVFWFKQHKGCENWRDREWQSYLPASHGNIMPSSGCFGVVATTMRGLVAGGGRYKTHARARLTCNNQPLYVCYVLAAVSSSSSFFTFHYDQGNRLGHPRKLWVELCLLLWWSLNQT